MQSEDLEIMQASIYTLVSTCRALVHAEATLTVHAWDSLEVVVHLYLALFLQGAFLWPMTSSA